MESPTTTAVTISMKEIMEKIIWSRDLVIYPVIYIIYLAYLPKT